MPPVGAIRQAAPPHLVCTASTDPSAPSRDETDASPAKSLLQQGLSTHALPRWVPPDPPLRKRWHELRRSMRAIEIAATTSHCPPPRTPLRPRACGPGSSWMHGADGVISPARAHPPPAERHLPVQSAQADFAIFQRRIHSLRMRGRRPAATLPSTRATAIRLPLRRDSVPAWHSPVTDSPRRRTSCRRCGEFIRSGRRGRRQGGSNSTPAWAPCRRGTPPCRTARAGGLRVVVAANSFALPGLRTIAEIRLSSARTSHDC